MPEAKTTDDKVREIRDQLNAIAPWSQTGDVTAAGLARHFAASALEYHARQMRMPGEEIGSEIYFARMSAMCAHFTAALALAALADPLSPPLWGREGFGATSPGELSQMAATQIRDCLEDGEGVGAWLYEFLGRETADEITRLVAELDEARAAKAAAAPGDASKTAGQ